MALRFEGGKWKGGTKRDAEKLRNKNKGPGGFGGGSRPTPSDPFSRYRNMDWESAASDYKRRMGIEQGRDITGSSFDKWANKYYNSNAGKGREYPSDFIGPLRQQDWGSKSTYQRSLATKSMLGKTVSASGSAPKPITTSKPNALGKFFNTITAPGRYISNKVLGMDQPLPSETLDFLSDTKETGLATNPEIDQPYIDEVNDRADAINVIQSSSDINSPAVQEAFQSLYSTAPSFPNNRRTETPSPVSKPYTPSPWVERSPIAPQIAPTNETPIQSNNRTVRRPVGMGEFSKGQYGNGSGDYGFQGMLGGDQSSVWDDILTTLGIKPQKAEAAQVPEEYLNQMPQMSTDETLAYFNPGYKLVMDTINRITGEYDQAREQYDAQGGYGTGGGRNTALDQAKQNYQNQQIEGYDKQMKAQKKALKELLKSIKKQYETKKTEGVSELERSKREDLLKLSGLFSMANQDPNSEQRMQYQERMEGDYATQLAKFLKDLEEGKKEDISGAKSQMESALASLMEKKQSAQQRLLELILWAQGGGGYDYGTENADEFYNQNWG